MESQGNIVSKWYEQPAPEDDVVLCTRVRLARNLTGVPFPSRMSVGDRRAVSERLRAAVLSENSALAGKFACVNMETASREMAVSLVERQLVSPDFISEKLGRVLFLGEDESFCVMVNDGDHVRIQTAAAGLDTEKAYASADNLETILGKSLPFAFDRELGFLTQDPVNLGTGMIASVDLHLPALSDSGSIGRISASLARLGLSMRGAYGSGLEPKGAVYRLSNQVTLGITEREALANLNSIAMQIIGQERAAREKLARELTVQDTVGRSYGILKTARLLTYDEFLELISVVRFGVAAGLIEVPGYGLIGRLSMSVPPATLALAGGGGLTSEQRRELRARIVSEALNRTA